MIPQPGGWKLEICTFGTYAVTGVVDPDGPQAPIRYADQPGGGCRVQNTGYPVRKYQGHYPGAGYSEWRAPT
jgi:hypothetical protein